MTEPRDQWIHVTVVSTRPDGYHLKSLTVRSGSTVDDVLKLYALAVDTPEWASPTGRVGIFGREVTGASPVSEGDRIECYRPLLVDPKRARRLRAKTGQ